MTSPSTARMYCGRSCAAFAYVPGFLNSCLWSGVFLWLLQPTALLSQTAISGSINVYAKVNAIAGPDLTVTASAGFFDGDQVLLIQMKGAQVDEVPGPDFGTILNYGSAGNYEYAVIEEVIPGQITLTQELCRDFDPAGHVQIVSVPVYTDAEVVAPGLGAPAWNGNIGGVLALRVSGTLTLSAPINLDGRGFRGGEICTNGFDCSDLAWATGVVFGLCQGGDKGEGIAAAIPGLTMGRARMASGGGGSTRSNAGSGGGSNGGAGGLGGQPWTGCGPIPVQGIGGEALDYSEDRVFAGGGGGGGYRDNSQPAAPGGRGGGIIMIEAGQIDAQGNSVSANGEDVTLESLDEGAGGGGAGGSIILRTESILSALDLSAKGGKGGDTRNVLFPFDCHGPGAGGGGGYIGTSLPAWPALPLVTTDLDGGDPGQINHFTGSCGFPSTHSTQPGESGLTQFSLALVPDAPVIDLGEDIVACGGTTVTLDAGPDFLSYLWSDGSLTQTLTTGEGGLYTVLVSSECGSATDSINITFLDLPIPDLGDTTGFCEGSSLILDPGEGFSTYLWSDASTDPTLSVSSTGWYSVEVSNEAGCTGRDSIQISDIYPLPVPELGEELLFCEGEEVQLDAGPGFISYIWNAGSTIQFQDLNLPGLYLVEVLDANGCAGRDSLIASWLPDEECRSIVVFPNAFTPNGDGLNDFFRPVINGALPLNFQMSIFNRWGEMVFVSNDYALGWDGTYRGVAAELGTYVWKAHLELLFEGESLKETRSGTITLLR